MASGATGASGPRSSGSSTLAASPPIEVSSLVVRGSIRSLPPSHSIRCTEWRGDNTVRPKEFQPLMTEYLGRGDARRSMALLWGTAEPPKRGPKQGLSVEGVVAAAIEVADREGIDALS